MDRTYLQVSGNKAIISGGASTIQKLQIKTNSPAKQHVTIEVDGIQVPFSGSGEHNTVIGTHDLRDFKALSVTCEYEDDKGTRQNCKLTAGGPYEIGKYRMSVVVAENGDDADYNDSIIEFSGYAK